MRIYEGSPRQDWEEVFRSVGAYLDLQGVRGVIFLDTDTGFIVQGLMVESAAGGWGETMGHVRRETLIISDDDVAKQMDEALARRGKPVAEVMKHYEPELRVIGRYVDERRPRELFFFEQDGSYVLRLTTVGQTGVKYEIVEFTPDDIAGLIEKGPNLRRPPDEKNAKR